MATTTTKCITLTASLVDEANKRGLRLSLLLDRLLKEHLSSLEEPNSRLKQANELKTKAETLESEANAVLLAEEAVKERIHQASAADKLSRDKTAEEYKTSLESELTQLRLQLKDTSNKDVESLFKKAWNERAESTKLYRAAFSVYLKERLIA